MRRENTLGLTTDLHALCGLITDALVWRRAGWGLSANLNIVAHPTSASPIRPSEPTITRHQTNRSKPFPDT